MFILMHRYYAAELCEKDTPLAALQRGSAE